MLHRLMLLIMVIAIVSGASISMVIYPLNARALPYYQPSVVQIYPNGRNELVPAVRFAPNGTGFWEAYYDASLLRMVPNPLPVYQFKPYAWSLYGDVYGRFPYALSSINNNSFTQP